MPSPGIIGVGICVSSSNVGIGGVGGMVGHCGISGKPGGMVGHCGMVGIGGKPGGMVGMVGMVIWGNVGIVIGGHVGMVGITKSGGNVGITGQLLPLWPGV